MAAKTVQQRIAEAEQREIGDSHLTEHERLTLVRDYRKQYPLVPLPANDHEAYLAIVFGD